MTPISPAPDSRPIGSAATSTPGLPTLGFIGAGRVARCLARVWARQGYAVTAVSSRSPATAAQLADAVPGCTVYRDAQEVVDAAELILLTVPDDAIARSVAALRFRPGQSVVHCSGASEVSLLEPARLQGAAIGGLHPLYLFSGLDADCERIAGASITLEAQQPLRDQLEALVRALGCTALEIPAGARMLYHATANYAASFVLCGLREAVDVWGSFGISEHDTLAALWPMLQGTLKTAGERGLSGALAGPVSRGDAAVVARQLERLQQLGGEHARMYAQMTRRAVRMARERAVVPPALDTIDALLAPYLD